MMTSKKLNTSKHILDLRAHKKKTNNVDRARETTVYEKSERTNFKEGRHTKGISPDNIYASKHEDLREGEAEILSSILSHIKRHAKFVKYVFAVISFIGWLFEKAVFGFWALIKIAHSLVFSPIRTLNEFLENVASFVRVHVRVVLRYVKHLIVSVRELRFSPPRSWYRQISVFVGLSLLLILPVKFSDAGVKIFQTRERVLGSSASIAKYVALSQALKEYIPAVTIAKEFAGFNGQRRFLLVSQNNAELRPTGGFMGWYGVIDIYNGKITSFEAPTGGFYDLKGQITRQIEAPEPFHIFSPYWQVWNANWFADYPTSARKLSRFYEISGGSTVDGVIMMTPNIIEDILEITGPIELEEYDQIIDSGNFRVETQKEVEIEYDKDNNTPKKFINDLMPELIVRILGIIERGDSQKLLAVVDSAIKEKHLLFYTTNEPVQKEIEELNWGGALIDAPKDYLSVVHTNIGGGKTDIAIKDLISVESEIGEDGSIVNTVSVTRDHEGDPSDVFEGHNNLDYLRLYVPLGSKIISAEGFTSDDITKRYKTSDSKLEQDLDLAIAKSTKMTYPDLSVETYEETGKTVFAGWLGLKPGQRKTITVKYKLPYYFDASTPYSIYLQKQSGTQKTPFRVSVKISDKFLFENWSPKSPNIKLIGDNKMIYTDQLSVDRVLVFTVSEN